MLPLPNSWRITHPFFSSQCSLVKGFFCRKRYGERSLVDKQALRNLTGKQLFFLYSLITEQVAFARGHVVMTAALTCAEY